MNLKDLGIEDAERILSGHAVAFRRGGKSRGVYLMWLDNEISVARRTKGAEERMKALVAARKAFTDEFYPT